MQRRITIRAALCALLAAAVACKNGESPPPGPADAGPTGPAAVQALEGALEPLVLSAWAASPDDVWLVGGAPGANGGLIAHFDGRTITRADAPPGRVLWWVWGSDKDHVWAVGEGGRILARKNGRWVAEESGLPENGVLWGVWGSSATDLWAVGGSLGESGPKGVVLRSNGGGSWLRLRDPSLPTASNLFKVWGRGPGDVHIVGDLGTAIHFGEDGFERVDPGTRDLIFTVHGRLNGEVLAVGGLARGLVFRWDGARWVEETIPESTALAGLYVRDDGTAIAGGGAGVLLRRSGSGAWTTFGETEALELLDHTIHGISAEKDVWVVGGRLFKGKDGLIATDRRPLPPLDISPPPPLPDAGPVDARPDTGARDLGVDAGGSAGEAGVSDAMDDQDAEEPEAGEAPGPGQRCAGPCREGSGLECLAIAPANWVPICSHPCTTPDDCAGFATPVCCMIPGPQTIQPYCVPTVVLGTATCP